MTMRLVSWKRGLAIAALLLTVVAAPARASAQPPAQTPSQDGFVPVDQLPEDEKLPAAPLLVAAYAVAWLAILAYLWSIWQRLSRVERELADVSRRLEGGGRR